MSWVSNLNVRLFSQSQHTHTNKNLPFIEVVVVFIIFFSVFLLLFTNELLHKVVSLLNVRVILKLITSAAVDLILWHKVQCWLPSSELLPWWFCIGIFLRLPVDHIFYLILTLPLRIHIDKIKEMQIKTTVSNLDGIDVEYP